MMNNVMNNVVNNVVNNVSYNPYTEFVSVVDRAAEMLGLKNDDYSIFKYPERELKVSIPVEMDDGTIIKATQEHKFLTIEGWKQLQELKEGDEIIKIS